MSNSSREEVATTRGDDPHYRPTNRLIDGSSSPNVFGEQRLIDRGRRDQVDLHRRRLYTEIQYVLPSIVQQEPGLLQQDPKLSTSVCRPRCATICRRP